MSLLEAIERAGGPADNAGITVIIRFNRSGRPVSLELPLARVFADDEEHYNPMLYGGEEVRIPVAAKVYVTGAVRDPGAFAPSSAEPLTVIKLITLAHGWLASAKPGNTVLMRETPQGRRETRIDLKKIFARKQPDVVLQANDILFVPDSFKKKAAFTAGTATAASAFYAVGFFILR
jgi:polysaccharide export outer membrane protein